MKTLLSTLFVISSFCAILSIAGLFVYGPTPADIGIAVGFVWLLATFYIVARWYLLRFGRIGLLKPKLFRKEPSREAYKSLVTVQAASLIQSTLSARMGKLSGRDEDIEFQIRLETRKIKELGYTRKTRTVEELETESKILAFVQTNKADRSDPPLSVLRDIRDTTEFFRLRKIVDDWYAERAQRSTAYKDWLTEVGDVDQSHLLKDGWIAFLESLPGADINLWHGIATDFHEMSQDRLDAAFWIVEQEICDRTTASEFIMGFLQARLDIGNYDTEGGKRLLKPDPLLDRFASVVALYNRGFYKFQSIPASMHSAVILEDVIADKILTNYERATGLTGLLRPKGIIAENTQPSDPLNRGYNSQYAFWDEAGLHRKYPGDNWREAS